MALVKAGAAYVTAPEAEEEELVDNPYPIKTTYYDDDMKLVDGDPAAYVTEGRK